LPLTSSPIEGKLKALGLVLPKPLEDAPGGIKVKFSWVRVHHDRAYVSGHGPQNPDGSVALPFGKVGDEVTVEQVYHAARLATLSMLGSLKRELGDLDRIVAWLAIQGFVNVAPGFARTTAVIDGCSDLILELYGPDAGRHARTAMGVATTPFGVPVVIAAEVSISS
jgi:enamine deaminase RidA (YjgF/YER057c/UK114 family)